MKKSIVNCVAIVALMSSSAVYARALEKTQIFEKNYIALSPMYSDVDVARGSKEAGFNLSFGTEIHKQWYAELGLNYFASGFNNLSQPMDLATALDADAGVDASGVHLAFLGKAKGQQGELYYRLGIAALKITSEHYVANEAECSLGSVQSGIAADDSPLTLCSVDDTKLAGMIGIGFDTFLGYETQLRFAIDHYRGEDDIQINAIQIGLRYNF